ncbi:MAG TPA: shikimate dehydrogenase [Beijerinckiaceae bacterium]|jgi:shikimate dehydrogenase
MTDADPSQDIPGLPLPLSGATRLYAIIGDPVAQVGSPAVFNAAFRRLGAQAVLVPMHVAAERLPDLVAGLRAIRNLDGVVATVPHKIAISGLLDRVEANGRRVGAVNAIRVERDGDRAVWVGDNFDGVGCVRGLAKAGHALQGRSALIVGAGGAGSAVAHALADAGVARIRVFDVDKARRERLAESLRAHHAGLTVETGAPDPEGFDVAANCTPLGMRDEDPLPIDPARLAKGALVVDVVLKTPASRLLREAERRGCRTQGGRAMLDGQVEAILQFLGFDAPHAR